MAAPAALPPNPDAPLIAALGRVIAETLASLVPRDRPVAHLDFPRMPNVGDSIIWRGTMTQLRRQGYAVPCYTCSDLTYDRGTLAERIGNGTLLLSGGGNLGDLYEPHQRLRERVIADFPDHRIVQLPQSIHFASPAALARARAVFDGHRDLTLLVRDEPSLAIARREFRAQSRMCPDMGFALGPLPRPCAATRDVVWLARSDKESAGAGPDPPPAGVRREDWLDDDPEPAIRAYRLLARQLRRHPALRPWLAPAIVRAQPGVTRSRLARGCRILSAGRVVVTDRLHGHILCVLLGIPHFVVDNSYGKVRGFHAAWMRESRLARVCASAAGALECAAKAVARG